jgi:predicted Zn-dependent protease
MQQANGTMPREMTRPSACAGRLPPVALLVSGLLAAALPTACATNPVTGRREFTLLSESQEIAIGREADAEIRAEMGVYDDPALQQYVSTIGLRLARLSERPHLPWQFAVIDQPAVNAFALPGGFIYITRGILPFLDSEAELAGVLGHEIGHVTARHSAQQYTRAVGGQLGLAALGIFVPAARPFGQLSEQALALLFLKYGRDDELEADQLGARYAASGGWDPAGVPGMLSTLGRLDEAAGDRKGVPNWLSTHPEPLARVTAVEPVVDRLKAGRSDFVVDRDALERRLDGLVFGDNPEQGVARGSAFLHPPLRFRVDFPSAWRISNSPRQVVAQAPGADVFMVLQLVEGRQGRDIEAMAVNSMLRAGFRPLRGERTTINGLDAFVGLYEGQVQGLGRVASRAAHIAHGGRVYLLAGLVAPSAFDQADPAFLASIRSFRALTAAEAAAIRPNRIDFYVVRAGDTWVSIAKRFGGIVTPSTLAVMNRASAGSVPPPGSRIKVVVEG